MPKEIRREVATIEAFIKLQSLSTFVAGISSSTVLKKDRFYLSTNLYLKYLQLIF